MLMQRAEALTPQNLPHGKTLLRREGILMYTNCWGEYKEEEVAFCRCILSVCRPTEYFASKMQLPRIALCLAALLGAAV
jgi:hypothetical protein